MHTISKSMTVAALLGAALTLASCEQNGPENQSIVNYEKNHDTAILLVTFGSTWNEPHATYEKQIAQFEQEFPNADIFFSFTSKTCINRWYAATGEQFITPDLYLESFIEKGYKNVYVQSLHVIPGEEFQLLRDGYVKPYYNFVVEDETYEGNCQPACLGTALLTSEEDIAAVGKVLVDNFASQLQAGEAVAFMGHGNPISDYDHANASYEMIEAWMQEYAGNTYGNSNVFVGTVDYPTMLIDHVIDGLQNATNPVRKVHLHPLMSIAGDHANNDMSAAEDTSVPADEQSWAVQIRNIGWEVETHVKGLGDYPAVNNIWINHLKSAISEL